ncbi:MAG: Helix-turn-helix domain [Chthoniobacter sp.]|nr:Helix-turn-helix domain [Chthoniobacter sp.]
MIGIDVPAILPIERLHSGLRGGEHSRWLAADERVLAVPDRHHVRAVFGNERLLAKTEEKIESIANQSGYGSPNAFFTAFRKAEKTTPAEFRKLALDKHL